MQLRAANEESLRLQDLPNQQPKGTIMKCASIVKAAAAVAVAVGLGVAVAVGVGVGVEVPDCAQYRPPVLT